MGEQYLAIDLGAESGRALLAGFAAGILTVHEIHRFPNEPVWYNGGLHWDAPRLWHEIGTALSAAAPRTGGKLSGIGVDTWGLDYALLGEQGTLLDNPYHYRDPRTDGMVERVCGIVPAEDVYRQTGIQFMQINTLYQLYAASLNTPDLLSAAKYLVTIPDLFNYWLTGVVGCEFTNATTTQFFDPRKHDWAYDLLKQLGIPTHFLAPVLEAGTVLGELRAEVVRRTGVCSAPVIAPACHDTGSAVAAIPSSSNSAFISSGTWSLLGAEVGEPVITPDAHRLNFTNEGGVCGTIRLLKNIAGMWLLQCCRRHWEAEGHATSYDELVKMARSSAPLQSVVDPDHPGFLRPDDMPRTIANFCRRTCQVVPEDPGAITRTILESVAMKYRYVLESLEMLTGTHCDEIRIVGGGARNVLLNQFAAEATARRVVAGPIEATALGNVAVQLLATGAVGSLAEARAVIDRSFPTEVFEPADPEPWQRVYGRFKQYCQMQ